MTVTSAAGQRVVVDLNDAKEGVDSFAACRSETQANASVAQLEGENTRPDQGRNQSSPLTDSERQAGEFIAALEAVNVPESGERSAPENLSPHDIVDEARQIYEEMLALPATEEGRQSAWSLEKRLNVISAVSTGMRNSPDWEAYIKFSSGSDICSV